MSAMSAMTRKTFLRLLLGIVVAPLAVPTRVAAQTIEKLKNPSRSGAVYSPKRPTRCYSKRIPSGRGAVP